MEVLRVKKAVLDEERKRIAREGTQRILSITPAGDDEYEVRVEDTGPRMESR